MTRNIKLLTIAAFLAIAPLLMIAQPSHPGGGNTPGPGNNPVKPIGDGIFILVTSVIAFGSRKLYVMRTTAQAEKGY